MFGYTGSWEPSYNTLLENVSYILVILVGSNDSDDPDIMSYKDYVRFIFKASEKIDYRCSIKKEMKINDIVYDGRRDHLYRNDLVLTMPDCVCKTPLGSYRFTDISKIIDYGRLVLICYEEYARLFDKITYRSAKCTWRYIYSVFWGNCLYEWYWRGTDIIRYVTSKDNVHWQQRRENKGNIKIPIDPLTMFAKEYSADLRGADYGIDLMVVYESRGIRLIDDFADLEFRHRAIDM